jgi:hypothetical protein
MIGLFLFILAAFILLIAFLAQGFQGQAKPEADASARIALGQMVTLQATSFVQGDRLLDDAEYLLLRANPQLRQLAGQLRKDRRELALLWIRALLQDLHSLWRFRRFVIQHGAPAKFGEEWAIVHSYVVAVIFLNLLKLSVLVSGPFAFARFARRAYFPVEAMSRAAANILARVPSAGWPDLERTWTTSTAA